MTFEPIEHEPDDYELDDEPAPRRPRRPGAVRRFWQSRTSRRADAEICRPVTVTGDDGQPVHTSVLGAQPMSEAGQAAFAEIVRATQRKQREELRAARQAADDDTRAVRALTNAASRMLGMWAEANGEVRRELWATLHDRADDVHDRFRERYAALDAREVETETAMHGQLASARRAAWAQRARDAKAATKRTPEEWCEQYDVQIQDPDGWRGKNDPPWHEPITLADFYERAVRCTVRHAASVDWQRIARDAKGGEQR